MSHTLSGKMNVMPCQWHFLKPTWRAQKSDWIEKLHAVLKLLPGTVFRTKTIVCWFIDISTIVSAIFVQRWLSEVLNSHMSLLSAECIQAATQDTLKMKKSSIEMSIKWRYWSLHAHIFLQNKVNNLCGPLKQDRQQNSAFRYRTIKLKLFKSY